MADASALKDREDLEHASLTYGAHKCSVHRHGHRRSEADRQKWQFRSRLGLIG